MMEITLKEPSGFQRYRVQLLCGHETMTGFYRQATGLNTPDFTTLEQKTRCSRCEGIERCRREAEEGICKCFVCGGDVLKDLSCRAEVGDGTGWGLCAPCVIRQLSRYTQDTRTPELVYKKIRDELTHDQLKFEGVSRVRALKVFPQYFHFRV